MLCRALLKVELARPFQRSRFHNSPNLGKSGHLMKKHFDRFWSKTQRFLYIEECYRTGIWQLYRKENAEFVGENHRTLALMKFEELTKNSFSEDGDYRQKLSFF